MCPGHLWLLKSGKVPGSNRCVEKKFKLGTRQYEEYKGVRFGNGDYDRQLVICAALKQNHGMGTTRYVLSVDNDNEFRSRCE